MEAPGGQVTTRYSYNPTQAKDFVCLSGPPAYGHIEVYTGKGWVSDFKQHSMIPYYSDVPPHTIYRFPNDQ